jgi:branched-chain amino acid transport system substrate-binding protein
VEWRNKAGGVNGRPIELLAEDDQQDPEIARRVVSQLLDRKVAAIVGPMTSDMAMATVPLVNAAQVLMISPTVTTPRLSGLDDQFFRVLAATTTYARKSAAYHYTHQGARQIVAVFDTRNQSYTASWLKDYKTAFEAIGGKVISEVTFSSSDDTQFTNLSEHLLQPKPDGILILANSVDTALLAQQIRKRQPKMGIYTSEWAATERLIELGGKAVEGLVITQFIDRESKRPEFLKFHQAFLDRFGQEPGFAGLNGFDAMTVVLDALGSLKSGQTLKQAIQTHGDFAGAQSPIRFDANGDAERETFLATIWNGQFRRLP